MVTLIPHTLIINLFLFKLQQFSMVISTQTLHIKNKTLPRLEEKIIKFRLCFQVANVQGFGQIM